MTQEEQNYLDQVGHEGYAKALKTYQLIKIVQRLLTEHEQATVAKLYWLTVLNAFHHGQLDGASKAIAATQEFLQKKDQTKNDQPNPTH